MYKSILVPTDGSKFADAAVEEAAKLAKELGSKLVLFSAVPEYYYQWPSFSVPIRPNEDEQARKAMETWAKEMLASAASNVNLAGVAVEQEFAVLMCCSIVWNNVSTGPKTAMRRFSQ